MWLGYILAALGSFLFATKGIFIKLAYQYHIDASELLSLRLFFSTPFFVIFGLLTTYRQKKRHPEISHSLDPVLCLKAMAVGILGYWVSSYADFAGLETLSPQFERLIIFLYPLFVLILGALFFKNKLKAYGLWFFTISYFGLAIVFLHDLKAYGPSIIVGTLWCSTCSVTFALYLLLAKPLIGRLGPSLFTSFAMTGAAIATFIHFFIAHRLSDIHMSPPLLSLCIGLAIGATVLPSYLTNFALSKISSQANAIISFINPIITLILSGLFLHSNLTLADYLGTLLVVLGVGLYSYFDQKSAPLKKPSIG